MVQKAKFLCSSNVKATLRCRGVFYGGGEHAQPKTKLYKALPSVQFLASFISFYFEILSYFDALHLLTNTWILFINVAVLNRYVSDPYNNAIVIWIRDMAYTDLTFEEKILSFVFNDREVVCHTGLSRANACHALLMRVLISSRVPQILLMMLPRYWNSSTSSTDSCPMLTALSCFVITFINLVLCTFMFNPTFSPVAFRSQILQRISCNLCAISSANSRSSKVLTNCHHKHLSDDPYASLATQSKVIMNRRG